MLHNKLNGIDKATLCIHEMNNLEYNPMESFTLQKPHFQCEDFRTLPRNTITRHSGAELSTIGKYQIRAWPDGGKNQRNMEKLNIKVRKEHINLKIKAYGRGNTNTSFLVSFKIK